MKDLEKILNVPFLFGLVAQGHIPTIEKMLADGKDWTAIGVAIGWCGNTAKEHYERYQKRNSGFVEEGPNSGVRSQGKKADEA